MSNHTKHHAAVRSVLLALSLLVAMLVAEVGLRLIPSEAGLQETARLLTTSTFVTDHNGVARLSPNQRVRSVLMVGDEAEFDVTFETNNLGFIDHEDYSRAADGRALAFVGDSFTAGVEGGQPWIPTLRERARRTEPAVRMYNLGMGAAGVRQFAQILDSVTGELAFDAIAILAITDDFNRVTWRPEVAGNGLFLCPQGESREDCVRRRPIAQIIDADQPLSPSAVEMAETGDASAKPPFSLRGTLRRSRLLVMLKRTWDIYGGKRRALFAENVAALHTISMRFPDLPIDFLHLPQKHEVAAGHYDRDLRADVEAAGMRYHAVLTACTWSEDLFHARDGHFTAQGYQVLSDCVAQLVVRDYLMRSTAPEWRHNS